jgi:hypothetical protein
MPLGDIALVRQPQSADLAAITLYPRADRGAGHKLCPTRLCDTAPLSFPVMSVASELRRRLAAGRPRLDSRNQAHGLRIIAYRDGDNVRLMTRKAITSPIASR